MIKKAWTPEEIKILVTFGPHISNKELAKVLDRTESSVMNKLTLFKIKKTPERLQESIKHNTECVLKYGQQTRFKKGHIYPKPKGCHKSNKNLFKIGNIPNFARAEGEELRDKDGFFLVKVGRNKWVRKQRLVWEQCNGPIPENMIVKLIDGNPSNTDISNLKLLTRAEHLKQNSIARFPKELRQVMYLLNKLKKLTDRHGTK